MKKLNLKVYPHNRARAEDFNKTTEKVDEIVEEINSRNITIEDLKANAVKKQQLATVNRQTLVNGGTNIDTTPAVMTDVDIIEIFSSVK